MIDSEFEKKIMYFNILKLWFWAEMNEYSVSEYIRSNYGNTVAIYGMTDLGELLYQRLKKDGVLVKYIVDKNPNVLCDCKLFSPEDDLPEIDVIIVTSEYYYTEIREYLEKKVSYKIESLLGIICYVTGLAF